MPRRRNEGLTTPNPIAAWKAIAPGYHTLPLLEAETAEVGRRIHARTLEQYEQGLRVPTPRNADVLRAAGVPGDWYDGTPRKDADREPRASG